ncbi:MAG: tyrosine-type recombinase/integrase [Xanthobacteraceae bacterium]
MREKLSEQTVKRLPVPASGNRITYFAGDTIQGVPAPRGFGVRVTAGGARSFILNYRLRGREHRLTVGASPDWPVLKAVREVRSLRQRVDRGENPLEDRTPPPAMKTVASVLDDFLTRCVRNKENPLRSADDLESAFNRLVKPRIGKIGVYDLRRSHIAEMTDWIEDNAGPVMADKCRAYTRKALSWYAERDDQYNLTAAFVRVRPRANQKERARTRVLSDEEIRIIWPVLGHTGTFGALVKMLLLTGQRRDEVANMTHTEIDNDGIWVIPAERYKTKRANHVPLSKAALALIVSQAKSGDCDLIFPSRAKTPYSGFTKSKAKLDRAVFAAMKAHAEEGTGVEPLPKWTPSRPAPHREDFDGSCRRAAGYLRARAWARHCWR